jgi:putative ABC transport system permease protein
MSAWRKGARSDLRSHSSSLLVAGLSSAFAVVLFRFARILDLAGAAGEQGSGAGVLLSIVASAFILIAVYVGAVVTTNTFSTVIAGRTRMIALLRLIGSSAATQRRAVGREGLIVGVVGGLLGAVVGLLLAAVTSAVLVAQHAIPDRTYGFVRGIDVAPVGVVALTTWLASWVGSRRVLQVSPIQAIGTQRELSQEESLGRTGRRRGAKALLALGVALLVLGIAVGKDSPAGLLIALPGGMASFTGFLLGAHMIMPSVLRIVGHVFGRTASARLARANAERYPERSTRTSVGIVIGVTLVTMFAVAGATLASAIADTSQNSEATQQGISAMFAVSATLVGFSTVIAAVGMVNNLSLNVLQRTRELGLLRALGLTASQVRHMILIESAQTVVAATITGLALGTIYGWAGAQSLFGASHDDGLLAPSIPWVLFGAVAIAAAGLAIGASVTPARRALRVPPVVALAVD